MSSECRHRSRTFFAGHDAALKLLLEVIHADVHKTLVITKAAMTHANKKTLKKSHLEFGAAIVSEIGGGLAL